MNIRLGWAEKKHETTLPLIHCSVQQRQPQALSASSARGAPRSLRSKRQDPLSAHGLERRANRRAATVPVALLRVFAKRPAAAAGSSSSSRSRQPRCRAGRCATSRTASSGRSVSPMRSARSRWTTTARRWRCGGWRSHRARGRRRRVSSWARRRPTWPSRARRPGAPAHKPALGPVRALAHKPAQGPARAPARAPARPCRCATAAAMLPRLPLSARAARRARSFVPARLRTHRACACYAGRLDHLNAGALAGEPAFG